MWVLPTLSRPKQCAEVLRRIRDSGCTSPGIVFINGHNSPHDYFGTDSDDKLSFIPDGWQIICVSQNIGCIGALNEVFKDFPNEPYYAFIADDEMLSEDSPRDWDQRLIAAAGDWKIAHGYEPWNHGKRCQGFPVWGGKLIRAVGYWALPTTWHNFGLDSHWEWLNAPPAFGGGGLYNLVYLPEIKIHHDRAKPDLIIDECYKLADSAMEKDRQPFWNWVMHDLKPTAERVRSAMALDDVAFP